MDVEMEPRVRTLPYKVKATSRESPAQKASYLLDTDLRNHWSTGTNTKEWILLELEEPCLLSHIRVYNKSVLEWEISLGLRYKPETFTKVISRCEAPRRDVTYPMSYRPCRYVRISCMRGSPIAIFFVQLIGIPVPCLEPEFQTIATYMVPYITSHKQDDSDLYLQLLLNVTSRLARFLPQLEADLNSNPEAAEPTLRFLAMHAGPFYPILHIASQRETIRLALNISDPDASKTNLPATTLTVSSNFEPRRSRNVPSSFLPVPVQLVFRPDIVLSLLRKAYQDRYLGKVCRMVSRVLWRIMEPISMQEASDLASNTASSVADETHGPDSLLPDYSSLFGEEFKIPDDFRDLTYLNVLDSAVIEEGIMHFLYACASQPLHCRKLAEKTSDFLLALPFIQALLPALRPSVSSSYQVDDNFSFWKQPFVTKALSQIVATLSSAFCRPLLHACAGYLASFSQSQAKAACVLIDLCSGVLSPWMGQVIVKIDLAMELLEDLLGVVQGFHSSINRARAALKYIVLALSGNMDDVMPLYKSARHQILFLMEMLERYLDPSFTPIKDTIAFGNVSTVFTEDQEKNCARALNIIRAAIRRPNTLPSLETEWRHGSATPSVLLSILDCRLQLPSDIDDCKFSGPDLGTPKFPLGLAASKENNKRDTSDVKVGIADNNSKLDASEDAGLLFAPTDLNSVSLKYSASNSDSKTSESNHLHNSVAVVGNGDQKIVMDNFSECTVLDDTDAGIELSNLLADYYHLMNYRDCELKASEFRNFALHLKSESNFNPESHNVAIDALLLAAECYINPCFMMSLKDVSPVDKFYPKFSGHSYGPADINGFFRRNDINSKHLADTERKRDRVVLEIVLEAAELDKEYDEEVLEGESSSSLYTELNADFVSLNKEDVLSADAISLVRQNQSLLFSFLIRRLQKGTREENSGHEILMWCLLFLLQLATKLPCSPEHVVDIILGFAKSLNEKFDIYSYELKGDSQLKKLKLLELQRCWILLHRLVIASTGSDERSTFLISLRNGFRFSNLVPALAWLQKVPVFSSSAYPLVRNFGWMAIARNSKQFLADRLFLVSDLSQLKNLLSVFWDELYLVDNISGKRDVDKSIVNDGDALYFDLCKFFPNLMEEFVAYGETILEAVGLHLKFLSSSFLPDLICWISDLCAWPFSQNDDPNISARRKKNYFKGRVAKNAKAVILYILESVVAEHMEEMVPEVPRVVQILVSLCDTSYCDVPFLESVLCLLRPIITYSTSKFSAEEDFLVKQSLEDFESLCFSELFNTLQCSDENATAVSTDIEKGKSRCFALYVLATIFHELSFKRKLELLQYSVSWAEFASLEDTNCFRDYISAYQVLLTKFRTSLVASSGTFGIIPCENSSRYDSTMPTDEDFPERSSGFLCDVINISSLTKDTENRRKELQFNMDEVVNFRKPLEALILKLFTALEQCWNLHPRLSKTLVLTCAECFIYCKCLHLTDAENQRDYCADDLWKGSMKGFAEMVLEIQGKKCWEVASVLLNSLLAVPKCIPLDNVIDEMCSAIKTFSVGAPDIRWRLQTDNLISSLLERGSLDDAAPMVDLFSSLIGHPEPEQRYIAVKRLGRLVGQDIDDEKLLLSSSTTSVPPSKHFLSALVSAIWDHVVLVASTDSSLLIRTHAMALLIGFVPFVERAKLQLLLSAADSIFDFSISRSTPVGQFSLALIANVCLYSQPEEFSLIPGSIWRHIEEIAASKNVGCCTTLEKKACEALYRLKTDGEEAKQLLKEVLLCSSTSEKQQNPDFEATRESILRVIGNLTSAKSYVDLFSKEFDDKTMELEEAEMELELERKDNSASPNLRRLPMFSAAMEKVDHRLQRIKDEIKSIEKAKMREEVAARRQQKLLMRHARQKNLEEAAVREAELIQKIDRDRADEIEKELERRQLLESERAKTRELQHNLDMEREKQAQRDLQREIEQLESGIRPSRREFASTRSRDSNNIIKHHRERDNSLSGGNRAFSSGQVPTILQARERSDEYEESFDVETGSLGDTGDGEGPRPVGGGYRGVNKPQPRQPPPVERREREGRKWEKKH